jgi:hypothetical protein
MNFILTLGLMIAAGIVGWILYDQRKQKAFKEPIMVEYSEVVGGVVVEHDKSYLGIINFKEDTLTIPMLSIIRPIPLHDWLIPTRNGKKKVYLIKLENQRYAYRIPSISNTVYIPLKDDYGNVLKNANGKPQLTHHKWVFCDDVVEPDVKHWDENIMEKLRQKHKTKEDILSRWILPIMVTLVLLAGIITIHMTTKYAGDVFDKVVTTSEQTSKQVKESAGLLDGMIKKMQNQPANNPDNGG